VPVLSPGTGGTAVERAFLRLRLAADTARDADAFETPGRGGEADASDYAAFVSAAARQAAGSHPGIELLAGLSAGAATPRQSGESLFDTFLSTRLTVTGYGFSARSGAGLAGGLSFLRKLARLEA
jgi:hypothetical protein